MAIEDTVRTATFDVLRRLGLTTIFSNPGSTEVPFLAGLPEDLRFVLALHEGSAVAMAAGHAIARGAPSLALLHSTPGLGNAVAALATARANRAPLVVMVGQQDRRHLALEPFLAGRLHGLAGDYPVWVDQPVRAQDVPGTIVRAYHEAATGRGPAIVIVPMDDWSAPAPEPHEIFGPTRLLRSAAAGAEAVDALADLVATAERPAIVVGAGADGGERWAALVELAERLGCPVWQEPFGGQAGFPQDHPRFAGHLPARRARLREVLAPHDCLLVVGAGAFRQYPYDPGPLVEPGTRIAVVTQDPAEAHRSPVGARGARRAGGDLRRPGRDGRRSPGAGRARSRRARRHRRRRRPGSRCARATCSPRSPSACRATRSCSRRRRRAAPSCTRASPPPRRSASSARWGCWASRCPRRSACAWRARTGRCWPSSATARRSTRSPRYGARWPTGSACCSSCSSTAATRSWTGSRSATARTARGRSSPPSTSGRWREARAARPYASRITRSCSSASTALLPALADRAEPLLLEVVVAPDATFDP